MTGDDRLCHKQWDVEESCKSSTWKELSSILSVLESFLPLLKGSHMKWFSQSRNWQDFTTFSCKYVASFAVCFVF